MYITEIFLQGFRNLSQLHIEPSEGINVIYGRGKRIFWNRCISARWGAPCAAKAISS